MHPFHQIVSHDSFMLGILVNLTCYLDAVKGDMDRSFMKICASVKLLRRVWLEAIIIFAVCTGIPRRSEAEFYLESTEAAHKCIKESQMPLSFQMYCYLFSLHMTDFIFLLLTEFKGYGSVFS